MGIACTDEPPCRNYSRSISPPAAAYLWASWPNSPWPSLALPCIELATRQATFLLPVLPAQGTHSVARARVLTKRARADLAYKSFSSFASPSWKRSTASKFWASTWSAGMTSSRLYDPDAERNSRIEDCRGKKDAAQSARKVEVDMRQTSSRWPLHDSAYQAKSKQNMQSWCSSQPNTSPD